MTTLTDPTYTKMLRLKGGRILGYAEYGQPAGLPVISFHGTPGSRFVMKAVDRAALAAGARIIAPDRPGYGISAPVRRPRLLDYVADIVELANALGLKRFAVLGISGGGPFPLACAYQIPERVMMVALVSAIGPLRAPNSTRDMMQTNKMMFALGRFSPALVGVLLPRLIRSGLPSMEDHVQKGTSPSPALSPEIFATITADQREAIRAGGKGIAFDMQVLWRPFGFQLEDVHTRTCLWHGAADDLAPASLAHFVADHLPNCEATFYPGEDHTGPLTKHMDEIMANVVAASRAA